MLVQYLVGGRIFGALGDTGTLFDMDRGLSHIGSAVRIEFGQIMAQAAREIYCLILYGTFDFSVPSSR